MPTLAHPDNTSPVSQVIATVEFRDAANEVVAVHHTYASGATIKIGTLNLAGTHATIIGTAQPVKPSKAFEEFMKDSLGKISSCYVPPSADVSPEFQKDTLVAWAGEPPYPTFDHAPRRRLVNEALESFEAIKEQHPSWPPSYPDVMVDIEAFNKTPDSAPSQIAIVFFDRDDANRPFLKFGFDPRPIDSMRLGFTVDAETLCWWDDHGMPIDIQEGEPLERVIEDISRAFKNHAAPGVRVWSRGNDYDISILRLLYHRTGKELPWKFNHARDVRTWLEGCAYKSPRKNQHIAIDDACNQAQDIIDATASMPRVTEATEATKPRIEWQSSNPPKLTPLSFPVEIPLFRTSERDIPAGCISLTKEFHDEIASLAEHTRRPPILHLGLKLPLTPTPHIQFAMLGWQPIAAHNPPANNRWPQSPFASLKPVTPRLQQVFTNAREESNRLQHSHIGTEHILLGILKLGQGVAHDALLKVGYDPSAIRACVEATDYTHPN